MQKSLELSWLGLAVVLLINIVWVPIIWSAAAVFVTFRYLTQILAETDAETVQGLDVFYAQALESGCGMINLVVTLEGHADLKVWQDSVRDRLLQARTEDGSKRFPKFTKCIKFWFGYPIWTQAKDVDLSRHVVEASEGPIGSEADFEAVVNKYFNRPIASGVPIWEIILIHLKDGWRSPRHSADVVGNSCVLFRCHHCYADGVSMVRIASEVLANDQTRVKEAMEAVMSMSRANSQRGRTSSLLTAAVLMLTGVFIIPLLGLRQMSERDRNILRGPQARRNSRKLYCWSRPMPLAKVKTIKNSVGAGCSVNDVIMSCVGGAIRRWMTEQLPGAGVKSVPPYLKVCMPVSLRPLDEPISDSNNMLLVTTKVLPGMEDPLKRLLATKKVVDATKESQLAMWLDNISQKMSAFTFPNAVLQRFMLFWAPSLVYSNVPGPPLHIDMLGNRVLELAACVPHGSVMGLTIAFISYCDYIVVSVVMDSGISEDMQVARSLVANVVDEIDKLECIVTSKSLKI